MPWTENVVREVLPNGLTLLVERDPASPVVAVVSHVKAGYFDEPDEWIGISHVLEHMFFKGSATRGPGELARETQALGGYLNAATIYDKTIYYAVVPSADDGLVRAMSLQADALMHAALDAGELAKEIEVIVQEAKRKLDTPGALTGETLYELMFRVHRIRRWRIGTEDGLRELTAGDLRRYYETRYTPRNVIISLAGDLEIDAALASARETYGAWSGEDSAFPGSPPEPNDRPAESRILRGDVKRPIAAIGWRGVGPRHPDAPALEMAASVLGRGKGSLLAHGVRKPGLAASISSYHYAPTEIGVFEIGLTSDTANVGRAVDRSIALATTLAADGPDPAQLARVRSLTATGWARRVESVDGRATMLAEFEALGDVSLADRYYDAVMNVTAADVRRVATTYLAADAACAAIYVPTDAPDPLADGWPRRPAAVPVPRTPAIRLPPRRNGLHAVGEDVGFETRMVAAGGADLLAKRRPGSGLVVIGAYFPGVRLHETPDNAGISWLLARSTLRGAAGLDADELAATSESLGGGIRPAVGSETLGWVMTVRADAAADAAALVARVAADPTLDEAEIAVERALQADDAARAWDDMFRYPLFGAIRTGLGNHPYGLPALGDPEGIHGVGRDDVRAWSDRLRRARPVVVAVGDLEMGALLGALGPFADWATTGSNGRAAPEAVWSTGEADERREKAQSALAMAFPGPTAESPKRFAAEVTGAILSGLAGRLFEELRERRALAYTVHAGPWLRRSAGAILTYIATSPEREGEARDAMLAELDRLAREPVPSDELERACNYAAGLVSIQRQHAQSVATEIAEAWLLGIMEDLPTAESALRSVTATDVTAFARDVFVPERRAEFVIRGSGKSR